MQLIDFDFRTLIALLISFFGSCNAFQSPEAVTIQTPTSITKKLEPSVGTLIINFVDTSSVRLSYISHDGKHDNKTLKSFSSARMVEEIKGVRSWAGKNMPKEVWLTGDNQSSLPTFKTVIQALRKLKIYSFKLITSPQ